MFVIIELFGQVDAVGLKLTGNVFIFKGIKICQNLADALYGSIFCHTGTLIKSIHRLINSFGKRYAYRFRTVFNQVFKAPGFTLPET